MLGYSQVGAEARFKLKSQSIYLLEAGKHKLLPRSAILLKESYEGEGIKFFVASDGFGPGIRWKTPELGNADPFKSALFRAARGLLNISQRQLATDANVDPSFIARLENDKFSSINEATLQKVEWAILEKNVELIVETQSEGAGVRWKTP